MTLVASILAVALSLSSPSQYRHVEVVETNLLTAVGMGAVATPGAKLAYTDAAFLAEAFFEREMISNGHPYADKQPVYGNLHALYFIPHQYLFPMTFQDHPQGWVPHSGFMLPSASFVNAATKAMNYEHLASQALYEGTVWLDICCGTNFFPEASLTNSTSAFSGGMPLRASNVALMYVDLAKLGPFAFPNYGNAYGQGVTERTTRSESVKYANLVAFWDGSAERFVYRTDYNPPAEVTTNAYYSFSYYTKCSAIRQKDRGWKYDAESDEMKDVTGVVSSSGYTDDTTTHAVLTNWPRLIIPFKPADVGIGVRSAKVFALAYVSRFLTINGIYTQEGHYVIVPINSSVYEDAVLLELGGPADMELIADACECCGFSIPSGSSLLESLSEPPDPSAFYSEYKTETNQIEDILTFRTDGMFLVVDFDFNAKTL